MSLVTDRTDLAEVLSTIDGVRGFKYRPKDFSAGDAWPLIETVTRDQGAYLRVTWRVIIILPTDEKAASAWFSDHLEDITDALDQFAYVEEAKPYIQQTGAGDVNAIELTMSKEA
jgi:hypothetical protein